MLDQGLVSIATTLLAVAGTLAGARLANRSTQKADKRKLLNEKVEEIYVLTNQVRDWGRTLLIGLAQVAEINTVECVADYTRPTEEDELNFHFWTLPIDPHQSTCPIDKIVALTSIYIPCLKKEVLEYHACISFMQNNLVLLMMLEKAIEGKTPINQEPAVKAKLEKSVEEITALDKPALMRKVFNEFRKTHIAFQLSLEKVVARD